MFLPRGFLLGLERFYPVWPNRSLCKCNASLFAVMLMTKLCIYTWSTQSIWLKRTLSLAALMSYICGLADQEGQGPVSRKSRNFSGAFRVTILFVSSKRRRLESRDFADILTLFSLYNMRKDQLYRIRGSEFYEWLFGTFEKRAPILTNDKRP